MGISESYFQKTPNTSVIGPQIGPRFVTTGVTITIGLPNKTIDHLTCRLLDAQNTLTAEHRTESRHLYFRNFAFIFDGLVSGCWYSYKFYDDGGEEVDLEGGLSYDDCAFLVSDFTVGDKFVLLSCNNPFKSKQRGNAQFNMWSVLLERVKNDPKIKFLIQGGDQIYNDCIEVDSLAKLKSPNPDVETVFKNVITNYQHFYGNLSYRKVMARLPSVSMLDDHDITDGWGGRPACFDANGRMRPDWQHFFDIMYEAFEAYQSVRNPDIRLYEGVASTYFDFGPNRLYLLDLRREKNIKRTAAPLVSENHARSILSSIEATPDSAQNIFVLSPVVPVRINPSVEESLSAFAAFAYQLRDLSNTKIQTGARPNVIWKLLHWFSGLGGFADLTDDFADGLSSKVNRKFLLALLNALFTASRRNSKNVFLLSGDIHTAGISEIFVQRESMKICIPQIVSSPIGYLPMGKTVKDKTTDEGEFRIGLHETVSNEGVVDINVYARNIFYRCDRNFAILTPGLADTECRIEFTFENLRDPIICSSSFTGS